MERLYAVSPRENEKYFLRLLLLHVKGAVSYEYLRTVGGIEYPTFQSACRALGLLEGDDEWENCLNEATLIAPPAIIRSLFTTILVFCQLSDPYLL